MSTRELHRNVQYLLLRLPCRWDKSKQSSNSVLVSSAVILALEANADALPGEKKKKVLNIHVQWTGRASQTSSSIGIYNYCKVPTFLLTHLRQSIWLFGMVLCRPRRRAQWSLWILPTQLCDSEFLALHRATLSPIAIPCTAVALILFLCLHCWFIYQLSINK